MASLSAYYPLPVVAGTTAGTYAEGDHSHELDELDASGIAAGKVLTANGLDAASWEDSTGQVEEAPEDGTPYARKDADWTPTVSLEEDGSIAAIVQVRQGTAAELGEIILNDGEIAIELEGGVPKQLKVGDGVTAGGVSPQINDWTIVYGTSEEEQTVTNSSSVVAISFFENAVNLDSNSIYQIFGKMQFNVESDNSGGFKITSLDLSTVSAQLSADWGNEAINLQLFQTDSADLGIINFQGFIDTDSGGGINISFAQKTATVGGEVRFEADQSYIAYRKIA
jgi:hypothetical protein